jgi:hypothetical protein
MYCSYSQNQQIEIVIFQQKEWLNKVKKEKISSIHQKKLEKLYKLRKKRK